MKLFLFLLLAFSLIAHSSEKQIYEDTVKVGKSQTRAIRSNETKQKLEFTHDGTNWKTMGSGSGGSGGENYDNALTDDDNPNAENGTEKWTGSGGVFNYDDQDPLEGSRSFVFTPSAQGDERCTAFKNFNTDRFKSQSCEARVTYVGGDKNLDLLVVDGNGDILNPQVDGANEDSNNRSLSPSTVKSYHSVSFLCPSQASIVADANKGNIKVCLKNTGATSAPSVKFDKVYAGTLSGLTEEVTPSSFSSLLGSDGSITSQSSTWLSGSCTVGTGVYTCPVVTGLVSQKLACQMTVDTGTYQYWGTYDSSNSSPTQVVFRTSNDGVASNAKLSVFCHKQGADSNNKVTAYRALPKAVEYFPILWAKTNRIGDYQNSSTGSKWWDSASCSSGVVTFNYASLGLQAPPVFSVNEAIHSQVRVTSPSTTNVQFTFFTEGGALASCGSINSIQIYLGKSALDFQLPTLRPLLIPNAVFYGPYDLTVSGTNWTSNYTKGVFYTVNGEWFASLVIGGDLSPSGSSFSNTIAGVSFESGINQPCSALGQSGTYNNAWTGAGTGVVNFQSGVNSTGVRVNCSNVKLLSKPTFIP
ncbi:hypothetical protein HBN50_07850 [Halobacteriovorax sp. GB3]|uniref:hypothetical protein n=1 Tax=Halobacteriovorax sp. GB3 TaxID=2719615 RepID=UPI0023616B01|nr:hypothetical protein [Halobacteriovorax sp. GB3]MDD0853005.1 hypothetical protein [Halobacteriovorax sp. GB3]